MEELKGNGNMNVGVTVTVKKEEECTGCSQLQDNLTKADKDCAFMKFKILEMEDELRMLKQKNEELERTIRNGNEVEEDKVTQLVIENKVLECEKSNAERDANAWKEKCKELEMRVVELQNQLLFEVAKTGVCLAKRNEVGTSVHNFDVRTENKSYKDGNAAGTPIKTTGRMNGGRRYALKSSVRKGLDFTKEGSSCKSIYPATPGGRHPLGPIDISDSDDDLNIVQLHDIDRKERKQVRSSNDVELGINGARKELNGSDHRPAGVPEQQGDEEEILCYNEKRKRPYLSTSKKRRVSKVVTSESDSDSDDNVPLCELMSRYLMGRSSDPDPNSNSLNESSFKDNFEVDTPRRRLVRLGNTEERGVSGNSSYKSAGPEREIPKSEKECFDEDEIEEDESEGESLDGFIVNGSDVSASASSSDEISEHKDTLSGNDSSGDSNSSSDDNVAFDEIISSLRRERKDKTKWEYEADMLADIGKCPNLCMKAVCALYRQQTSEEKSCKATILLNGRGFSQIHAPMGSKLAEFLTDGDAEGDVTKSVEELQEFNGKGVELCRKLATNYSKQLFEIYKKKEDPFFEPQ